MAASLHHMMEHPLGIFALLVAIAVLVPPLTRRLRLPDLVGLLAAGVLVGPHCLQWLDAQGETITLLSDIGAIYLLFTVGLEIDGLFSAGSGRLGRDRCNGVAEKTHMR